MIVTALSAGVIAEAIVLLVLSMSIARLRQQLAGVRVQSTAAVHQMSELVQEAQALSTTIAGQLAEGMRVAESLRAPAPAPEPETPEKTTTRRRAASTTDEDEAPKPARKTAAGTATKAASTRSRTKKTAEITPVPAPADDPLAHADDARAKGMDPLGLALQRRLARNAS